MLDITFLREQPDLVRKNLERRNNPEVLLRFDEFLKVDQQWRDGKSHLQKLQQRRNEITREIAALKKTGQDIAEKRKEMEDLPKQVKAEEERIEMLFAKRKELHQKLPNMMHESVPYGKDDTENVEVRKWGTPRTFDFPLKSHVEIAESLGIADFDRSAKLAGSGFYFLKGDLALLNQALVRFAIEHLVKKGFIFVEPPLMMRRAPYEGCTDLSDFQNVMYKIEDDDLYLIATSEHPLVAQYQDEVIEETAMPVKLCGYSMCFRREVGSRGIDTKGLYRTHQFNKVEQVVFCKPEDSWKLHEEILKNSEELFQALELPYRIVNVCTGDLGIVAAKKYDLEVWMPRQDKYGEACSASNCTDYQTRRLQIKCGKHGGETQLLHSLNNTAIATSRALVAILENNQNADGSVTIPKVLVPYMMGKTQLH